MTLTSKQIVKSMTFGPQLECKVCSLWISYPDSGSDILDLEGFDTEDKLVELLAKLSLTHYVKNIHRTDFRNQTDIDITIEPSTNGRTNINANVVKAILDFYISLKEYWVRQ